MNYINKYLKYKNKYLELKGGKKQVPIIRVYIDNMFFFLDFNNK